jgi:head-tail adaptor
MTMILPQIGELKEIIDIVNVSAPYDLEMKGAVASVAVSGLRAKVEPLGGSVDIESNQVQTAAQEYRIWIRYRDGLTPWQQIKWGTRQLAITGPIENMQNRFLLIHAQERTSKTV